MQRSTELAAAELGAQPAVVTAVPAGSKSAAKVPVVTAAKAPVGLPPAPRPLTPAPVTVAAAAAAAPKPATTAPASAPASRKAGSWRVQLGAFGVATNADRLWRQIGGQGALAGTRKVLVPSGNITRLMAIGFTSEAEASRACATLKREGKACVVAGQG